MWCIINQVFELILADNIACHFLQLTEACLNCPEYFRRLVNKTTDGGSICPGWNRQKGSSVSRWGIHSSFSGLNAKETDTHYLSLETSGFYPTQEDRAENGGKREEQLADHRDKLYQWTEGRTSEEAIAGEHSIRANKICSGVLNKLFNTPEQILFPISDIVLEHNFE